MAISVQNIVLAKRRAFNYQFKPQIQLQLQALFSFLNQFKGGPDLQIVPFDNLTGTDVVAADAPCRVYAIWLKKETTVAAFFKGDDSATTVDSAAADMKLRQNTIEENLLVFPTGLVMGTGFAMISDTTSDGLTGSSAGDGATGFVILGRP